MLSDHILTIFHAHIDIEGARGRSKSQIEKPSKNLLTLFLSHGKIIGLVSSGAMAERLKALVLKTSDTERYRGFESLSLRQP